MRRVSFHGAGVGEKRFKLCANEQLKKDMFLCWNKNNGLCATTQLRLIKGSFELVF